MPGGEDRMASLLEARDFDYVIGSVHFLRDEAVDMEDYSVWGKSHSPEEIWKRYFETLGEAARSGLFDVLAHPDLVKVWGADRPLPEGDLRSYYELAMDGIAESQIAVEVSTAGLRKPVGEMYPAPAFLQMCLEAGAPVALSSDAHRPEDVGADYEQALELLVASGVQELCVFERREHRLEQVGRIGRRGSMSLAGIGYDSHRLAQGRRLILGGVEIPGELGLGGALRRRCADPCGDRRPARRGRVGRYRRALPRHRRALARRRFNGAARGASWRS